MGSGSPSSGTSVVPLPAVTSSRNEGPTFGALVPIFARNEDGDVDRVLAPIVTWNHLFGVEAGAHAIYYRDSLALGAGAILSSRVARNLYLEVLDEQVDDSRYALELFAKNEVDPSSRFWGLGPTAGTETNDTFRETVVRLNFGINLLPNLQLFARERFRDAHVGHAVVPNLPSTGDLFARVPGFPDASIAGEGIEVRWDGRDEAFLPRNGWWVGAVAELNVGLRGNTGGVYPRWIVDARAWFTLDAIPAVTFCARVRFERLTGSDVPFYEQAILGGRNSIRAYGSDRWTDLASALVQVEARITVLKLELFGTRTLWQVVPFFDDGRVFHDLQRHVFRLWRWSPGCGFRLAVPPNIIARVDVAYGDEGANVFVGLGVPF